MNGVKSWAPLSRNKRTHSLRKEIKEENPENSKFHQERWLNPNYI
jgi:hypothetical protein